jgi:hypothetical protein
MLPPTSPAWRGEIANRGREVKGDQGRSREIKGADLLSAACRGVSGGGVSGRGGLLKTEPAVTHSVVRATRQFDGNLAPAAPVLLHRALDDAVLEV